MSDELEKALGGEDLFGGAVVERQKGPLAEKFLLPPFTILNAREGWWQARKDAWKALGIRSEIGRGGNLLQLSAESEDYRTGEGAYSKEDQRRAAKAAAPGGGGGPNSAYFSGATGPKTGSIQGKKNTASLKGGLTYGLTMDPYKDQRVQKNRVQGSSQPGLTHHLSCSAYTKQGEPIPEGVDTGTSIFDPVLCELAYRWFCPEKGQVIDPFAGGSVRGIVAALLGRKYWGSDLAGDQIVANEAQGRELVYGDIPRVETFGRFRVVRDDQVPGGTKERALRLWLPTLGVKKVVYATPAQGYAQVALARVGRELGIEVVLFTAARKELHQRTLTAQAYGARIEQVSPGYLAVVEKRAADWAKENDAYLCPFGLDCKEFIRALSAVIQSTPIEEPKEVWCAAGSGTLSRAIQRAWPNAVVHSVAVGRDPEVWEGEYSKLHVYDRDFAEPARIVPPFPSCQEYDAKAWEVMQEKGSDGALFWNVASDAPPLRWVQGDSRKTLDYAPEADLVFSCPPYADLEVYSKDPADLSNMEWAEFQQAYFEVIDKACQKLKNDRFACFVVGDVRGPDGTYRDLPGFTTRCFRKAGLELYNEAILVTAVGSLSIRAERQFHMSRKMGRTHQSCLVYVKGDAKRATDAVTGMRYEERQAMLEKQAEDRKAAVAWEGEL
jgi:DNA modification methylase